MADSHSTVPLRTCTKCAESKPHSEYTKVSRTKIGLSSQCKACRRLYYEANSGKIKSAVLANWNKRQEPKRSAKAEARAARLAAPTKRCGRCHEIKPKVEFGAARQRVDGLKPFCKICHNAGNKKSREKNPENSREASRRWVANNRERATAKVLRWLKTERGQATSKAWRENSREHRRLYWKERRKDPNHRVHHAIRARLQTMLRNKDGRRTEDLVGYCASDLVAHLERQFTKGMTWDNYGEWHVDHIVPLSSFKVTSAEDPDLRRAWALTNLRPLWADENRRKHAKRVFLI